MRRNTLSHALAAILCASPTAQEPDTETQPLIQRLRDDATREAAIDSLVQIGEPATLAALKALANHQMAPAWPALLRVLERLPKFAESTVPGLLELGRIELMTDPAFHTTLLTLLPHAPKHAARAQAIQAMPWVDNPNLHWASTQLRACAITLQVNDAKSLVQIVSGETAIVLNTEHTSPSFAAALRVQAALRLTALNDPETRHHFPVIAHALSTLRKLEDGDVEWLHAYMRQHIADAMVRIDPESDFCLEAWMERLHSVDAEQQIEAVRRIGIIGPKGAIAAGDLLALISDESNKLAYEVVSTLGMIGAAAAEAATPTLEKLAESNNKEMRARAAAALRQIQR